MINVNLERRGIVMAMKFDSAVREVMGIIRDFEKQVESEWRDNAGGLTWAGSDALRFCDWLRSTIKKYSETDDLGGLVGILYEALYDDRTESWERVVLCDVIRIFDPR